MVDARGDSSQTWRRTRRGTSGASGVPLSVTPDLLELAGRALFGDQWQRALARALGVGDREMRRWKAGQRSLPLNLDIRLLNLMGARIRALQDLHRVLEGRAS